MRERGWERCRAGLDVHVCSAMPHSPESDVKGVTSYETEGMFPWCTGEGGGGGASMASGTHTHTHMLYAQPVTSCADTLA